MIATAAQQQIAGYLASDGKTIPDANAALQKMLSTPLTVTVFQRPGSNLEALNFATPVPTTGPVGALANVSAAS